jgi:ribonuclease P/MRP protein subunit POP7
MHAPIASSLTGAATRKVVYVTSKSAFVPTIKRVRKYLDAIEKRSSTPVSLSNLQGRVSDQQILDTISKSGPARAEDVVVTGTGKAIDKVLQVGLYLQSQDDVRVTLSTGTVGTVDDCSIPGAEGEDDEREETRIRRTSKVEVSVSLR